MFYTPLKDREAPAKSPFRIGKHDFSVIKSLGSICGDCWDRGAQELTLAGLRRNCHCGNRMEKIFCSPDTREVAVDDVGGRASGRCLTNVMFDKQQWPRANVAKWARDNPEFRFAAVLETKKFLVLPQFPAKEGTEFRLTKVGQGLFVETAEFEKGLDHVPSRMELLDCECALPQTVSKWLGDMKRDIVADIIYRSDTLELLDGKGDVAEKQEASIPLPTSGNCPPSWPVRRGDRCFRDVDQGKEASDKETTDGAVLKALGVPVRVTGFLMAGAQYDRHEIDVVCQSGEIDLVSKVEDDHEHELRFTAVEEGLYEVEYCEESIHGHDGVMHKHRFKGTVYKVPSDK